MDYLPARAGDAAPGLLDSLRHLMRMRNVLLAGLAVAVTVMDRFFLGAPVPLLATLLTVLILANAGTYWRLHTVTSVAESEVMAQSALDVAVVTLFFYFSGGATNPFIDLFLIPLAGVAITLPRRDLMWLMPLTLACYLLLVKFHVPLPAPQEGSAGFLCVGMWLKYLLIGGPGAWLLHKLSNRLRDTERKLAQALQRAGNRDYLMRVGTLAAGAAHEITSPLCTMSVLANELMQNHADRPDLVKSLRLILGQIDGCRAIVSQLMRYGREALGDGTRTVAVDSLLRDVVERWRVLRPSATLGFWRNGTRPPPVVAVNTGLDHAIMNLLNNAADASPQDVQMQCRWTASELRITVLDSGPGFRPELLGVLGEQPVTTKQHGGTGIGLLLAHAAVDSAGGTLTLQNRPEGGARAEVVVPLAPQGAAGPSPASQSTSYRVRYFASGAAKT